MTNPHAAQIDKELKSATAPSIVNLVDSLINHAHSLRASDVHIDAQAKAVRVRYRIDGVLQDAHILPRTILPEVVSRIKILSDLRIDEHQAPQDGRFRIETRDEKSIDVRVAITPSYHGESIVMRLLAEQASEFTLESLGFSKANIVKISKAIQNPYGMILATGPTGSGKTTTLYTILKMLNTPGISIITIEDPIEYAIGNIKQIPVNSRSGLTFASGLRSILRQDPDVIMVGEVRDIETAGLAVNTALTGHLLLSTLHTNDAATTLPRLFDMRVEPYLVASTVNIALGQRLVRKICEDCKVAHTLTALEINSIASSGIKLPGKKFYKGEGCEKCNDSGYQGRIGIHEVLIIDDSIRQAILLKESADTIKKIAVQNGMTTMLEDGFIKASEGLTTIEEVLRVSHE